MASGRAWKPGTGWKMRVARSVPVSGAFHVTWRWPPGFSISIPPSMRRAGSSREQTSGRTSLAPRAELGDARRTTRSLPKSYARARGTGSPAVFCLRSFSSPRISNLIPVGARLVADPGGQVVDAAVGDTARLQLDTRRQRDGGAFARRLHVAGLHEPVRGDARQHHGAQGGVPQHRERAATGVSRRQGLGVVDPVVGRDRGAPGADARQPGPDLRELAHPDAASRGSATTAGAREAALSRTVARLRAWQNVWWMQGSSPCCG